jgi:hypothetical protein
MLSRGGIAWRPDGNGAVACPAPGRLEIGGAASIEPSARASSGV